jgi:hypothetical protein
MLLCEVMNPNPPLELNKTKLLSYFPPRKKPSLVFFYLVWLGYEPITRR